MRDDRIDGSWYANVNIEKHFILLTFQTVEKFIQKSSKALREGDQVLETVMRKHSGTKISAKKDNDVEYNSCFFWRERFFQMKKEIVEITEGEP